MNSESIKSFKLSVISFALQINKIKNNENITQHEINDTLSNLSLSLKMLCSNLPRDLNSTINFNLEYDLTKELAHLLKSTRYFIEIHKSRYIETDLNQLYEICSIELLLALLSVRLLKNRSSVNIDNCLSLVDFMVSCKPEPPLKFHYLNDSFPNTVNKDSFILSFILLCDSIFLYLGKNDSSRIEQMIHLDELEAIMNYTQDNPEVYTKDVPIDFNIVDYEFNLLLYRRINTQEQLNKTEELTKRIQDKLFANFSLENQIHEYIKRLNQINSIFDEQKSIVCFNKKIIDLVNEFHSSGKTSSKTIFTTGADTLQSLKNAIAIEYYSGVGINTLESYLKSIILAFVYTGFSHIEFINIAIDIKVLIENSGIYRKISQTMLETSSTWLMNDSFALFIPINLNFLCEISSSIQNKNLIYKKESIDFLSCALESYSSSKYIANRDEEIYPFATMNILNRLPGESVYILVFNKPESEIEAKSALYLIGLAISILKDSDNHYKTYDNYQLNAIFSFTYKTILENIIPIFKAFEENKILMGLLSDIVIQPFIETLGRSNRVNILTKEQYLKHLVKEFKLLNDLKTDISSESIVNHNILTNLKSLQKELFIILSKPNEASKFIPYHISSDLKQRIFKYFLEIKTNYLHKYKSTSELGKSVELAEILSLISVIEETYLKDYAILNMIGKIQASNSFTKVSSVVSKRFDEITGIQDLFEILNDFYNIELKETNDKKLSNSLRYFEKLINKKIHPILKDINQNLENAPDLLEIKLKLNLIQKDLALVKAHKALVSNIASSINILLKSYDSKKEERNSELLNEASLLLEIGKPINIKEKKSNKKKEGNISKGTSKINHPDITQEYQNHDKTIDFPLTESPATTIVKNDKVSHEDTNNLINFENNAEEELELTHPFTVVRYGRKARKTKPFPLRHASTFPNNKNEEKSTHTNTRNNRLTIQTESNSKVELKKIDNSATLSCIAELASSNTVKNEENVHRLTVTTESTDKVVSTSQKSVTLNDTLSNSGKLKYISSMCRDLTNEIIEKALDTQPVAVLYSSSNQNELANKLTKTTKDNYLYYLKSAQDVINHANEFGYSKESLIELINFKFCALQIIRGDIFVNSNTVHNHYQHEKCQNYINDAQRLFSELLMACNQLIQIGKASLQEVISEQILYDIRIWFKKFDDIISTFSEIDKIHHYISSARFDFELGYLYFFMLNFNNFDWYINQSSQNYFLAEKLARQLASRTDYRPPLELYDMSRQLKMAITESNRVHQNKIFFNHSILQKIDFENHSSYKKYNYN